MSETFYDPWYDQTECYNRKWTVVNKPIFVNPDNVTDKIEEEKKEIDGDRQRKDELIETLK